MSSTAKVRDHELPSFGFVESATVNSINDFTPSKLNECEIAIKKENDDFINTFICHIIFYSIFCVSVFLHVLIDLGLGAFVKNKFSQLLGLANQGIFEKSAAFA
tara:strand:- start:848 stop:1159 length:312 start_codon:yes stop_codon:yes gene_type:complete